ncbi:hypothetical protein UlMin_020501 [Ulmus minor]
MIQLDQSILDLTLAIYNTRPHPPGSLTMFMFLCRDSRKREVYLTGASHCGWAMEPWCWLKPTSFLQRIPKRPSFLHNRKPPSSLYRHHLLQVSMPNEEECFQIIKLYTKKIPMDSSADLQVVAASCNGFFGADLEALCRKASISAIKHSSDLNEDAGVTVEIPKVTWEDIGGLRDLKLQQAVEWPFKHSTSFTRLGITLVRGILLHGHPGCSKTTLAKAAAHVAQASFFSLSGAELYSMYAGDGEPLLRNTFQRARLVAPGIIFFDEADVVTGKRFFDIFERLKSINLIHDMDIFIVCGLLIFFFKVFSQDLSYLYYIYMEGE